jgi:choline dehydrogenase-like flavoprotein
MGEVPITAGEWDEITEVQQQVFDLIGAQPLGGGDLVPRRGGLGGVAHEVGTMRMGTDAASGYHDGVVDEKLQALGHPNLYVCDLSVFPSSPAANPTLTLAALAIRLARYLKSVAG